MSEEIEIEVEADDEILARIVVELAGDEPTFLAEWGPDTDLKAFAGLITHLQIGSCIPQIVEAVDGFAEVMDAQGDAREIKRHMAGFMNEKMRARRDDPVVPPTEAVARIMHGYRPSED